MATLRPITKVVQGQKALEGASRFCLDHFLASFEIHLFSGSWMLMEAKFFLRSYVRMLQSTL